jgi:hypothetical protein
VTGQEVLTALIDQLLADPKLAAQITRAIQDTRRSCLDADGVDDQQGLMMPNAGDGQQG